LCDFQLAGVDMGSVVLLLIAARKSILCAKPLRMRAGLGQKHRQCRSGSSDSLADNRSSSQLLNVFRHPSALGHSLVCATSIISRAKIKDG
jgi:hypothetical protein